MSFSREVKKALGVEAPTPEELVATLLIRLEEGNWTASKWRLTKASVIYGLLQFHHDRTDLIERIETARAQQEIPDSNLAVPTQKPIKELSPSVFQKVWELLEQALTERSKEGFKNALPLREVLRATLLTGLLTREWGFAKLQQPASNQAIVTLLIQDHLSPDYTLRGIQRELVLNHLPNSGLQTIEAAIETFKGCTAQTVDNVVKRLQKEFADTIKSLKANKVISRTIKTTLSKLTILSFRHQFALRAQNTYRGNPLAPWILNGLLNNFEESKRPIPRQSTNIPPILVLPSLNTMRASLDRVAKEYGDFFVASLNGNKPI